MYDQILGCKLSKMKKKEEMVRNLNLVKYVHQKKQAGRRKMRMIAMKKKGHAYF